MIKSLKIEKVKEECRICNVDIMEVTVTIPTMGIINPIFKEMVSSLNKQFFSDFKTIFIVPAKYVKDPILEVLENTNLDFLISEQNSTGFENAMNTAIKVSGDLNLNMDDDAYYYPNHVLSYIELFNKTNAGMIFGKVNTSRPYMNKGIFLLTIMHVFNKKPLISSLDSYSTFFNSSGFLSAPFFQLVSHYNKVRLNSNPIGVNMGWVKDAVKNVKLLEFSKKGTLNEAYIALEAINSGFSVFETNSINVNHSDSLNSLSRGNRREDVYVKIKEFLFSPLVIQNYSSIKIEDFNKAFKRLNKIQSFLPFEISNVVSSSLEAVKIGLSENWDKYKIKDSYNNI